MERRLAAIVIADVAGYSQKMAQDEGATYQALQSVLKGLLHPKTAQHNGRVVKEMGDGVLLEFASVVDAVTFCADCQGHLAALNATGPPDQRLEFRMGVNIGDVIGDGGDILGNGVNVAARLETQADPGGVCLSAAAVNEVAGKVDLAFRDLGEIEVHNIPDPVRVFALEFDDRAQALMTPVVAAAAGQGALAGRFSKGLAVAVVLLAGLIFAAWTLYPVSDDATAIQTDAARPGIAILPFRDLGGDESRDYVSAGLTSDLATDIARFRRLLVISPSTSLQYRDTDKTPSDIAAELGVAYLVTGSLQWSGDRFRLNVDLTDTRSGQSVWSERFERSAEDLFDVQTEIIREIAASLAVLVDEAELRRALHRGTDNLGAYDLYLRANHIYINDGQSGFDSAVDHLEQAIALDPAYARAKGQLAWILWQGTNWGWIEDKEPARARAFDLAKQAVRQAPDDYTNYATLAFIYLNRKDYDRASANFDKALGLNPNDPDTMVDAAQVLLYLNRPDEAVTLITDAMRISPRFPEWYYGILGWAYDDAGAYEKAVDALRRITSPRAWVHRRIAVSLVGLGRIDEAKQEIGLMLEKDPGYRIKVGGDWPYKDRSVLDLYAERLRLAGTPE